MTAQRTTLLAVFSVCALSLAAVTLARTAADAAATSDIAVIESDTLLAAQGRLQLGAYSRFQWHHPGPLAFYLLAPYYVASGERTAGLSAGAVGLNLASLALIAAVLLHCSRPAIAVATSLLFAVYAWRGAEAIASPWNPHVAVLPFAALLVAGAAAVSGTAALLPVVALLASLCAQAHVALLPSALAIGVAACAGAGATARTHRRVSYAATSIVLLLAWLPPLVEQLTTPTGNGTLLWNYFVRTPHTGQPFAVALSAWSDMLSGILRPDFYVAHGWRFVESPVKWAEALAGAQLVGLLLVASDAFRRRRHFDLAFSAMLAGASALALWSATRIDGVPDDHAVYWITGIGILNLGVIVGAVADRAWTGATRTSGLRLAQGLAAVALVAAADAGVAELRRVVVESRTPGGEKETVAAVADDVMRYMTARQLTRPVIRIDQDAWGIAAGVILRLQKRGVPVAVEADWLVMFTPEFAERGAEPAAITIAARTTHVRLLDSRDSETISSHDPIYAHAAAIDSGRGALR